jgi:hypothetical protein
MTSPLDFTLEDLMVEDARGEALRASIVEGIRGGEIGPILCLQIAQICRNRTKMAMGLRFLGMAFRGALPKATDFDWPALCGEVLTGAALELGAAADPAPLEEAAAYFYAATDGVGPEEHLLIMSTVLAAFAKRLDAGLQWIERLDRRANLRDTESFLGTVLAVRQFNGDISAARDTARRLALMPDPKVWTVEALIKFALLDGDYRLAENLARRDLAERTGRFAIVCSLAVALFCQGREAEGREELARFDNVLREVEGVRERQGQIAQWSTQLEEAMANGVVDGGELGRIGSAVHYTDAERVRTFYHAHREECVEKNTYLMVSAYTNHVMFGEVEALLAKHPDIRKVINYGTLCGIREYELAERHPDVVWAGYDVSDLATQWNREAYRRDNLIFEADFEALLAKLEDVAGGALLVHCRTLDIMLPEAVKRVYRACRAHGVDRIMTAEYFSRCLPTLRYPDFELTPVDTVHWDGILVIHNYAKIFPEVGYRIAASGFRPVPLLISANGEGMVTEQMIQLVWAEADPPIGPGRDVR